MSAEKCGGEEYAFYIFHTFLLLFQQLLEWLTAWFLGCLGGWGGRRNVCVCEQNSQFRFSLVPCGYRVGFSAFFDTPPKLVIHTINEGGYQYQNSTCEGFLQSRVKSSKHEEATRGPTRSWHVVRLLKGKSEASVWRTQPSSQSVGKSVSVRKLRHLNRIWEIWIGFWDRTLV